MDFTPFALHKQMFLIPFVFALCNFRTLTGCFFYFLSLSVYRFCSDHRTVRCATQISWRPLLYVKYSYDSEASAMCEIVTLFPIKSEAKRMRRAAQAGSPNNNSIQAGRANYSRYVEWYCVCVGSCRSVGGATASFEVSGGSQHWRANANK